MGDKKAEEDKKIEKSVSQEENKKGFNTSRLLNIFLSLIILITVVTRNNNLLFNI